MPASILTFASTICSVLAAVIQQYNDYEIDEARERLDFTQIHAWLRETYWSPGIERERVERAAQFSSLVVGAYHAATGIQAGYLRVISDRTTFGYFCDVYVDAAHRGQGLARAMARFALTHPEHQNLRRWLLVTRDAQGVYAGVGFAPLPLPERWMAHVPEKR